MQHCCVSLAKRCVTKTTTLLRLRLEEHTRLPAGFFFSALCNPHLPISFDFEIVGSNIPGISQIVPINEDALSYLVEETSLTVFKDGSTALFDERVGDFISDASHAHLCCTYSY